MIIDKRYIGAHGRKTVYVICADATETGDRLHDIAKFDTLETATVVLRYMTGCAMSDAEETAAREAIKKTDVPTDESKHARKAS